MIPSKSAIGIPGGLPPLQRSLPLRGLGTARQRGACGQATWRQPWGAPRVAGSEKTRGVYLKIGDRLILMT